MSAPSIDLRRAATRGELRNDGLHARFSFSFGRWQAPHGDAFGPLRALNEDCVQPGRGFAMHPHRNLEILILPLAGLVEHRDSQGRHAVVRPGEVQLMRAGRGIEHSQMNPSADRVDHHLQIWIEPRRQGLEPGVWQRPLPRPLAGRWQEIATPEGAGGSVAIDQDVRILLGLADRSAPLAWQGADGRSLYLHMIDGRADVRVPNEAPLSLAAGDALAFFGSAASLTAHATAQARCLLFDVPEVSPPTSAT